MSLSEEGESLRSVDNEQINQFDDYEPYVLPEEHSGERSTPSIRSIRPRWRVTPRTVDDFVESKTSITSCRDSDYEAWLENYYQVLHENETKCLGADKQVDTSDLISEKLRDVVTSSFPPIRKDVWSEVTKYWGPKAVRRHWPLQKKKGEYLFLPAIHPLLNLSSRYGRFHSQLNSAAAVPEHSYKTIVCTTFKKVLEGILVKDPQLLKIMLSDNLCNLRWLDAMTKTTVVRCLCKFLRTQYEMEKVYFENMNLDRIDGIILLCALSRNSGDTLKELHMWKMFGYGQCPPLLSALTKKGTLIKETKMAKYFSKIHYFQILNKFSSLTHLSINYAYLTNQNGDALLCLKSLRTGSLKELRLLCLKDERPLLTNPGFGVGGFRIADGVWRRVAEWCPYFRVKFVFLNMPQYENVILFLSKSIPVSYFYLSSGIDFNFEVPWDVDSTLLEVRNWYAPTLETLCLHLWHHRDLLDFVIRKKILEEFPNLITFEFIGVLEDVETLEDFCCQLSKGTYKLKSLLFWVEEQYTRKKNLNVTRKRVDEIRRKYHRRFQVIDIDANLKTFAL